MVGRQAVRVVATGSYLPPNRIDNTTLAGLVGPLPSDVLSGLQVRTRCWIVDPATGQHTTSTTTMAEAAVRTALDRARIDPHEVDLLAMSTASPEYPLPAAVTYLQTMLGLKRCATVEVRGGCAGALHALDIARRRIADGAARVAVVVGSEAISPLLVPRFLGLDAEAIANIRMRDRIGLYTFGDGAAAIVLRGEPTDNGTPDDFLGFADACLGSDRVPGLQIIGGGTHAPINEQLRNTFPVELKLDIAGSARFGPHVFAAGLRDLLRDSGLTLADLDVCVVPEGNAGYFTRELEAAGITAVEWAMLAPILTENLALVGATGSAAVPLALDHAWSRGQIKTGDRVALLAIESSRWLYAGVALSWSATAPTAAV